MKLALQVSESYDNKVNPVEDATGIHKDFVGFLSMNNLNDSDAVSEFILNIHKKIDEICNVVNTAYPETGLRLYERCY